LEGVEGCAALQSIDERASRYGTTRGERGLGADQPDRDLSLENVCRSTPRWLWRGQRGGGALEVGGGEPGSHQGCSRAARVLPLSSLHPNRAMIISMVLIQAASH
jgi:hypothetical protein